MALRETVISEIPNSRLVIRILMRHSESGPEERS